MRREGVQHVALRFGRKQKLLIVLSVDIGQVRRQIFQQRYRHRAAADEGARFAAGQDLALDQQFAVFDLEAGGFEQRAGWRRVAHVEDAGHAAARFAGADHVGRGAPPSSSPSASTTMDLPLPVSPVSRFRPA